MSRSTYVLRGDVAVRHVAVVVEAAGCALVTEMLVTFPEARLTVLVTGEDLGCRDPRVTVHRCPDIDAMRDVLRTCPRVQLLVEAGGGGARSRNDALVQLMWFVEAGGTYVVEGLLDGPDKTARHGRSTLDVVGRLARARLVPEESVAHEPHWMRVAARSVDDVVLRGRNALVGRSGAPFQYALRHDEADAVLRARYGDAGAPEVLLWREAYTFESRAELVVHGEGPDVGRERFDVPPRALRRYRGARLTARQLARYDDYWLPDTFRHFAHVQLGHRKLERATPYFQRLPARRRRTRELEGTYFYLDTELPGHFGHVTTEVLGRMWGWPHAVAAHPGVRPLVSLYSGEEPRLPGFQRQMLEAFEIDPDSVAFVHAGEEVVVEGLVAATPQFENPYVIDGDIAATWRALADGLPDGPPAVDADKIFVSRRTSGKRDCLETDEIERFFADLGFAVVFPEDMPYWQQAKTFARARVIAGFGGSGMFSMLFAPHARVILIASDAYTAQNEYLFAAANGNEIHYFWGTSQVRRGRRWSAEAFTSAYSFDLAAHAEALRRVAG